MFQPHEHSLVILWDDLPIFWHTLCIINAISTNYELFRKSTLSVRVAQEHPQYCPKTSTLLEPFKQLHSLESANIISVTHKLDPEHINHSIVEDHSQLADSLHESPPSTLQPYDKLHGHAYERLSDTLRLSSHAIRNFALVTRESKGGKPETQAHSSRTPEIAVHRMRIEVLVGCIASNNGIRRYGEALQSVKLTRKYFDEWNLAGEFPAERGMLEYQEALAWDGIGDFCKAFGIVERAVGYDYQDGYLWEEYGRLRLRRWE